MADHCAMCDQSLGQSRVMGCTVPACVWARESAGDGFPTNERLVSDNARLRTALSNVHRHMVDCKRGNMLPQNWAITEAVQALSGDGDLTLANVET